MKFLRFLSLLVLLLTSCTPPAKSGLILPTPIPLTPTPKPTQGRPAYPPGKLVDYTVQTGDTLETLALRFNTSVAEIREANPVIPAEVTTLPPGMPMKIPIYYLPLWGSAFQVLPDGLFINGPAQVDFDTAAFIAAHNGWLKDYTAYAFGGSRSAAEIIDYVATNYSVSPRLLLALLDYQSGALSFAIQPLGNRDYPLGYRHYAYRGLYLQLGWAANRLNQYYYAWRTGKLLSFTYLDERLERFDPWQNGATVALTMFFADQYPADTVQRAVGPQGLAKTYQDLFGDPWANPQPHLPGSLEQPALRLPFLPGKTWVLTGGPHTGWGSGDPRAALDFAPPLTSSGCVPSSEWATAVADGVIVRTDTGLAVLDLDGDGDERTGWTVLYLHLASEGKVRVGDVVRAGDPMGLPSCEGGSSTGTHVHLARKYNGEWMPASVGVPFDMEGWEPVDGDQPYEGFLRRGGQIVTASLTSNPKSHIRSGE